jgi:hypothetical protein
MHWTYENFKPDSDLYQGDILEPTEEIRSLLSDVHPHFLDPKYTAFMIVTQSCDMAMRNGVCNAKYINVAVVRPLSNVINDLLSSSIESFTYGVYPQEKKNNARMLMARIFNQNEQALGLFYLHPDIEGVGIGEPSISLIRVTFTLRVQHYEVLRKARRGRLKSEFRSKFGWLVGNLYARVGTEDWSQTPERKKELEQLIIEHLDNSGCAWVKSTLAAEAKDKGFIFDGIRVSDINEMLRKFEQPPTIEKAIERVRSVVNNVCPTIEPDELKKISNRLRNDEIFTQAIKRA